jgi:uncharacterized protein with PIN domain
MARLVADRMLGKLARILRMIGSDVEYEREGSARAIADRAASDGRVLLTRDTRLAKALADKDPKSVLFITSDSPFHQARQAIRSLALPIDDRFSRCVEDNGLLVEVSREAARPEVPSYVADRYDQFMRCERCKRVFWAGTHLEGMRGLIAALEGAPLIAEEPPEEIDRNPAEPLSLEPLLDVHQAFDVAFLEHRVALMRGDLPSARQKFARFKAWLMKHLEDENTWVLPLYARSSSGFERSAGPDVFLGEHEKIQAHVNRIGRTLEALSDGARDPERRSVECLRLLDREKVLADLLEHHDLRERQFLYPALERLLSAEEKAALIERVMEGATRWASG